jgi:CO/xanthine dehydrogenase Mo-binding subunit
MSLQHVVGQAVPRVDGAAKVSGAARYLDDLDVPGVWHGATVRSHVAHGVVRAIRLDPDYDWTGVVVVTAADVPGENLIALIEDDQPALVGEGQRVRHIGEAVALVAAASRQRARDAAQRVYVEIEPLPAVFDMEAALAGEVTLHGSDNIFKTFQVRRGDDIDAALAACDVVVEGTYRTSAQEQMYIEPQAVLARWDERGACRVVGSMQCPYYVHKALKRLLGLGNDRVIVSQSVTGGGFGGKEDYPSLLTGHAALLARRAGRPVKMVYDRGEDIAYTTKRHPALVRHRLGLRSDGTTVACDVELLLDGGAYVTLSPVVLSRALLHAAGPYRFDHVRLVGRAVATNTPPHGAFRGFGAPQTTFAYERQMQKAARQLGIAPLELRRRNMLRVGDQTATGQTLDHSVGADEVLAAVAQRAQATPVPALPRLGTAPGRTRRGQGLAFCFHGAGFTGSGETYLQGKATVAARADGTFEIRTSSTDIGQGMLTIFAQIAADALGVGLEQVTVAEATTERVPDSGPTVASRTCMVVGRVVEQAARGLREQLEAHAGQHGLDARDLSAVARHRCAGGELVQTSTYESPPGIAWDDATYTGSAYPVYGWAACLVDVAVDLDTYEVTVERCIHAVDVGKAINPVIVKGQIDGGTVQALGWALWEHVVYREGLVVNASMTDCIIPTFWDVPELDAVVVETPYPYGPHGAKGVGEIPVDGPAAAVASAIEDALRRPFDELPILPETIERACAGEGWS